MISKPLFKQSCKANAVIWSFVTAVTCFMLAIIILVLGNLNVNEIRASMTDMFISDAIESNIQKQSMTYYNLASKSLSSYDANYTQLKNLLQNQLDDSTKLYLTSSYDTLIASGKTDAEAREQLTQGQPESQKVAINTLIDYYLVQGNDYTDSKISGYVLSQVQNSIYNQILQTSDEETANNAKDFITTAINDYIASNSNDIEEFTTNYIPFVLKEVFFEKSFEYDNETVYISSYFNKDEISSKSYSAIISFRAEMNVKEKQIKEQNPTYTDEQVQQELDLYTDTLIAQMSKTLVDELPEKVTKALNEIGDLDVYGLVIGSIFFKIAGLLLPMIFVIMTANNLIAGQVDSGSMAYVLSTPTKRRTVTITQMLYLITSLLLMFIATTLTSVICLAIVNSAEITISYGQIILLNVGAFVTMLAVSGICFLASSWFNRSKISMSCGGGLTMFFLVATILGLFGSKVIPSAIRIDAMNYFNYVSIISLFDVTSILGNTLTFLWKFAILIVIAIITYTISIIKFDKKDLPL